MIFYDFYCDNLITLMISGFVNFAECTTAQFTDNLVPENDGVTNLYQRISVLISKIIITRNPPFSHKENLINFCFILLILCKFELGTLLCFLPRVQVYNSGSFCHHTVIHSPYFILLLCSHNTALASFQSLLY